jgi:hypothetical protein
MRDERKTDPVAADRTPARPRVRPAGVFRAAVLAALAAGVPSAGCTMASDYGVPPDADAADVADAGEDGETSAGAYGVPEYGAPSDAGADGVSPEGDFLYGVP